LDRRTALDALSRARERFHRYVDAYVDPAGRDAPSPYPGLSAEAWYDPARFPIVPALEAACASIRAELGAMPAAAFHREAEPLRRDGSWDVLLLYERGRRHDANCAALPAVTGIVERFATVRTLAGLVYFSRMVPGTRIAPHRGPTNLRVRCHLALTVPAGDCALRVGGETRRWVAGTCAVFNDFLEHEAWNATSGERIVLVVDLWHPDLSEPEVGMLEAFHARILRQALNLQRYWADNDRARAEKA